MGTDDKELSVVLWLIRLTWEKQKQLAAHRQRAAQVAGKWLRKTRQEKGLGLHEASRQLGISAPYLSDMELGRRMASEKWITKAVNYKSK